MISLIKNLVIYSILLAFNLGANAQDVPECGQDTAFEFFDAKNYQDAREAFKALLKKPLTDTCSSRIYYQLGKCNIYLSNFAEAISNFQNTLSILGEEPSPILRTKALSGIADAYSKLGDFEKAYSFERESLKIGELSERSKSIARSRYHLGNYAFSLKNYTEALEHYLIVQDLMLQDTTTTRHEALYGAIGCVYTNLGQPLKAIDYLEKSAESEDAKTVAYAHGNLGQAYAAMRKYERAIDYFIQGIQENMALGDQLGVIGTKLDLGGLLIEMRDFAKAQTIINEAADLAIEIDAKTKLRDSYETLTRLYKAEENFQKAYLYLEKFTGLKDEILNEESRRRIDDQRAIYENDKKDAEIKSLKEIEIERDLNDRLKKYIFLAVLSFLSVLLVVGLVINRKLLRQNESLATTSRALEMKNVELENFAYIASHDLKEPLRTINSFTNLLERKYVSKLDGAALEYMDFIHQGVDQMKNLLEDLLNYSRVDRTETKRVRINSQELLQSAIGNLNTEIEQKHAQIILESEIFPDLEVVPSQMIQLFQNLIGNAVKFTNGHDPVVWVNWTLNANKGYQFSVKDNGIGIEREFSQKIFEMFTRLHNRQDYEGTGIGLATCRKIVENYGGKIWVESEIGEGATFYFTLPG